MMIKKVDHLGVAVRDLAAAIPLYRDVLGLPLEKEEEIPTQGVRAAFLAAGEVHLELLAPTDPEGPIARFLARRGEGIHHVAFAVEDIREAMARARAAGLELLSDEPRPGAGGALVVFIHPRSTRGVLIELVQRPRGPAHPPDPRAREVEPEA
ncbi:MAG: methylmalonyl-CoA epimerase [Firmicutes bacterium]|nr:methylmalonyl-CoA epimerase [Bacillota bacterium]